MLSVLENTDVPFIMFYFVLFKTYLQQCTEIGERYTVEPQWLEHLWDRGNSFETWVVRATEE